MKKSLTLLLILIVAFSLSSSALAADQINIDTVSTAQNGTLNSPYNGTTINYKNNTITITGTIPANIIEVADPAVTLSGTNTTYTLNTSLGSLQQNNSSGTFTLYTTAEAVKNQSVLLNLSKTTVTHNNGMIESTVNNAATLDLSFAVAANPVLTSMPTAISSGADSLTVTQSGNDYYCRLPFDCNPANTITFGATVAHPLVATVNPTSLLASQITANPFPVSITVTNENNESNYYNFYISKGNPPSNNANLSKFEVKNGSTVIGSATTLSTSSTAPTLITVPYANRNAALSLSADASDTKAKSLTVNPNSVTLNTAGQKSALITVSITAEDNTTITNYYAQICLATQNTESRLSLLNVKGGSTTLKSCFNSLTATSNHSVNIPYEYTAITINHTVPQGATIRASVVSNATYVSSLSTNASQTQTTLNFNTGKVNGLQSVIRLIVTAENGAQSTYNITLIRSAATATSLSNIYIKNQATSSTSSSYRYTLSPSFSSTRYSYSISVPEDENYIYIYPTTPSGVSTELTGGNGIRYYEDYYRVTLNSGSNTIKIKCTASGASATTYTVSVERSYNVVRNASLTSLYVRQGQSSSSTVNTLSPSFVYNQLEYDAKTVSRQTEAFIFLSTYKSGAAVSVSGASLVSEGIYRVNFNSGASKTVTIRVKYGSDTTTYTVNLGLNNTKAKIANLYVASSESTSSSKQYQLYPAFSPDHNEYLAVIPYQSSRTTVNLMAKLNNANDILTIDNESLNSYDWTSATVSAGSSKTVELKVKDGGNTNTYRVTLVHAAKNADNEATLDSLSLRTSSSSSSAIALSPSFSAGRNSYSASVDSTTNHLRVYTTPEDAYAYVMINDIPTSSSYTTVDLTEGSNTIKILVIAADCEHTKTYTINVNRDKTLTEVYLSGLLAQTDGNKALTLSPAFSEKTLVYSANVNEKVNSVKFMPVVANSTYSIRIQGTNKQPNMWTNTYTLKNGLNTFLIVVTDSTGLSSSNYTVNITKRGPVKATVSYQSLTINGKKVTSAAYLVNDNNYFKLRDIAYALNGSAKQFSVGWDEKNQIITVNSGKSYKATGDEMKKPTAPKKTPYLTNHRLSINGTVINDITAYNINDNNYYKLRDLAAKLNFSVSYDEKNHSVNITTTAGYNG